MNFDCPKWLVFQVTEKCNLRCKMCYEWGENGAYLNKKESLDLDIDVAENIIKVLAEKKSPYYELFGGEPLMYPHLKRILKTFHKYNCDVDISTNGTLLSKYAQLLIDTQVRRIWVSIDGSKEFNDLQRGTGVFDKAVKGLEDIYTLKKTQEKKYPLLGVTMVVTPLNYTDIVNFFTKTIDSNMLDYISVEFQLYTTKERFNEQRNFVKKEFGINNAEMASGLIRDVNDFAKIDIDCLILQMEKLKEFCAGKETSLIGYPKTITVDNISNFYHAKWDEMQEKKTVCSFPWLYLEISANGNVTPCHTFYEHSVGNVYHESIRDIWGGEKLQTFRKKLRGKIMPICCSCSRYYSDL